MLTIQQCYKLSKLISYHQENWPKQSTQTISINAPSRSHYCPCAGITQSERTQHTLFMHCCNSLLISIICRCYILERKRYILSIYYLLLYFYTYGHQIVSMSMLNYHVVSKSGIRVVWKICRMIIWRRFRKVGCKIISALNLC